MLLIAAIPLEVTTASSVPSSTAIFAARACMQELHLGFGTRWLKGPMVVQKSSIACRILKEFQLEHT